MFCQYGPQYVPLGQSPVKFPFNGDNHRSSFHVNVSHRSVLSGAHERWDVKEAETRWFKSFRLLKLHFGLSWTFYTEQVDFVPRRKITDSSSSRVTFPSTHADIRQHVIQSGNKIQTGPEPQTFSPFTEINHLCLLTRSSGSPDPPQIQQIHSNLCHLRWGRHSSG